MAGQRGGAVRSETARRAILDATAHLFTTRGYDHLSIEGVATQAGVGKQTIYRWWPSKSALVAECLHEGLLLPHRLGPPDTGDIRADLLAWLQEISELVSQPVGENLFRSLVAAAAENADVGRRLSGSLGAGSSLSTRLEVAIAASQLSRDAPVEEIGEAIIGALTVRVIGSNSLGTNWREHLIDAVLGPVRFSSNADEST